jgi:kumamolisin
MVPLAGSERSERPGATLIGPVPDDELIKFAAVLRARPDAPDLAEVARTAAVTGEFLSREEVTTAAAPDPADVTAVEEYAQASGLSVEGRDPLTRRVLLSGPAGAVRQAFGVSLSRYAHEGGTFRGRTGPVLIPASLAGVIVGVLGTDNRPMARRAVPAYFSGESAELDVVQMTAYYNYPPSLDGTGQCIGIIAFGGGYYPDDIAEYFLDPTGLLDTTTPPLTDVFVSGGSNSPTPAPPAQGPDYTEEVELDIEVAGAAAPGASIAVYFVGDAGTNAWAEGLSAAFYDVANNPSVISISYGLAEDSSDWTPQLRDTIDHTLATLAAAGLTVLVCSGDHGFQGTWPPQGWPPPDQLAHVDYPASSPNATAVGGTVLVSDGRGGISTERTWNNGPTTASGGGVSDLYPVPPYQYAAEIFPASANPPGKLGRGVPDVSANASSYPVIIRGQTRSDGRGTSAATPLWAGLIARVNQGLGWPWCGLLQPVLYPLAYNIPGAINDVIEGDNGEAPQSGLPLYPAGPGWDPCTGLGSPNGLAILLGYRQLRQVAPVVISVSAPNGSPGDTLNIIGSNFLGATAVFFGAVSAGIGGAPPNDGEVVDDTFITVTVPAGPASGTTVDVTVTAPGGTSAIVQPADQFTYN